MCEHLVDRFPAYPGLGGHPLFGCPGPITSALCWAHARRQFFELADIAANARRGKNAGAISPIALEAVRRIDALFKIERGINGVAVAERLNIRKEQSAPLLQALEAWLREQRGRLSRSASVAEPIDYMLKRWDRMGSWSSETARHGRYLREIAALTSSVARSLARICHGAPLTTCSALSTPSRIKRRIT